MKKISAAIILVLIYSLNIHAQLIVKDTPLKVIEVKYDTIYYVDVIPLAAMNPDSCDVLVFPSRLYGWSEETHPKILSIEISWYSPDIDGRYNIVLTPLQIYIRTTHDNPNSDALHWLQSLRPEQYIWIKKYIEEELVGDVFEGEEDENFATLRLSCNELLTVPDPEDFRDMEKEEVLAVYFRTADYINKKNIEILFGYINAALPGGDKLELADTERWHSVLIVNSLSDLCM
ncbi:hypothetical protein LJC28_02085 [Dysgonomonas sp. OttesenSCG-928-D17]|nr:hypothetical protein [Dysgonomonas sp. OttesenSCG-928-D17]